MAQVANTYSTYDNVGIREDLNDVISNISPEETPFISNIGTGPRARNTFFEWQQDELAAADTSNAQIEGDDLTSFTAASPTVRLGNYTQISRKDVIIADTTEAVDRAGRQQEMAYQLAKKMAELKRDMEAINLANQGAVAGDDSTARKTGALLAFLKTNTDHEGTGADPVYTSSPTDTRTDGAVRAFAESQIKTVMQSCYEEGGKPTFALVSPVNKINFSGFAGIAEKRWTASGRSPGQAVIIGAADVYVSDFGELAVVPDRFQRDRDVFLLDSEHAHLRYLRPLRQVKLAKTGDAEKRMLINEWGLCVVNEKALGGIFDLNGTLN